MLPEDPIMLLSIVNTKLRDYYPTLEALCDDLDEDAAEIKNALAGIDYEYDAEKNQFV